MITNEYDNGGYEAARVRPYVDSQELPGERVEVEAAVIARLQRQGAAAAMTMMRLCLLLVEVLEQLGMTYNSKKQKWLIVKGGLPEISRVGINENSTKGGDVAVLVNGRPAVATLCPHVAKYAPSQRCMYLRVAHQLRLDKDALGRPLFDEMLGANITKLDEYRKVCASTSFRA